MILVNKPYLPEMSRVFEKFSLIWETNHLTNDGPIHNKLEKQIASYLNINDICLINNCTNGLLMSLSYFNSGDEIITTPFSFVATTSSISWSKLKPVFCDIDTDTLFLDVSKVEKLITKKTKAVLATHVFGNTGDIELLSDICKRNNIKLIFDAAHAFGVKYKGKSILEYGDISILSLHATKLYHTIEGGAIYSNDSNTMSDMRVKKNFGYQNYQILDIGINSKMSEFNAAMGMCVLEDIDTILSDRKESCELYNSLITNDKVRKLNINENLEWNYSYYPIIFDTEENLLKSIEKLNMSNIYPRRYFYPSLNTLSYLKAKKMKNSEDISSRIMCLPLFYGLDKGIVETIAKIINSI